MNLWGLSEGMQFQKFFHSSEKNKNKMMMKKLI